MAKSVSVFDFTRRSEGVPSFTQIWKMDEPEDCEEVERLRGTFVLQMANLLKEYDSANEARDDRLTELNIAAGSGEASIAEQNLRRAEEKLKSLRIRKEQALLDIVEMFGEKKERFMAEVAVTLAQRKKPAA